MSRSSAIRLATRGSALALAQAGQVAEMLGGAELVEVSSDGEAGDKARFVRGVEAALLAGEADVGVHSAKDLPAESADGLAIGAVPRRADPADVWIGAGASLDQVVEGARVGTASLRRRSQLLAVRPDLRVEELHGNVDTRLRRLEQGDLDAIVLAAAGLERLGRAAEASFSIEAETMTPAAGQGALVLQTRQGDSEVEALVAIAGDSRALIELTAERAVVALLRATCASPIGVHASLGGPGGEREDEADHEAAPEGRISIEAYVGLADGTEWIRDRIEADAGEPALAGAMLAERLLGAGARQILDRAEQLA
jgi:hydroxymethylbilane synthase